jgi:peptide/nickel transport system ATP-binding protein
VLETTGLSKVYGSRSLFTAGPPTVAAIDVSLSLKRGRTLGNVGESRSGKSRKRTI